LLGATDRGQDLSRYSRRSVESLHGRLLINPTDRRSRIYYGRGADGLETPLPGSPQGEAIDEAGALNVTGSLGRGAVVRVRPEQILAWNPDLIIAEDPRFYDRLYRDRYWRQLTAVRQKHVYLAPSGPFGWIDDPPGVNRIIGLYWLSTLLYPEASQDNLRARIPELYEQFYAVKLTDAQLKELIARAGVPDDDAFTAAGGPLGGLGALTNPHGPPVQAAPRVTPITPDNAPGITGTVPGLGPPGRRGSPSQGLPADQGLPNPPPPQ
jgi:iron complex transport system substrate-binding protein